MGNPRQGPVLGVNRACGSGFGGTPPGAGPYTENLRMPHVLAPPMVAQDRAPGQVSLVSGPLGEPTVLDHEEVSGLFQLEVNFVPVEVDVVGD